MYNLLLLPGDGVGPEIIRQGQKILDCLIKAGVPIHVSSALVGGAAIDSTGESLPSETLSLAKQSDAILFGAVGGDRWDSLPMNQRPEKALLQLRKELDLFANLRPATLHPDLSSASSLKPELIENLDLLIVRELTAGIYFGEPRGISTTPTGEREGFNTYRYKEHEIKRIAKVAFEAAEKRKKSVCSVDKANVLEVTALWREIVEEESKNYPDVDLSHMYVDNAAMQLVSCPKQFDVVVTGNMFGDILSDISAILTGSIGMLPSASLNAKKQGLYEPVHGSAPDIAGQDKANPIATIASLEMLLRMSLNLDHYADLLKSAVSTVLSEGYRTADIFSPDDCLLGTEAMGNKIAQKFEKLIQT